MIEHRLIQRMLAVIEGILGRIDSAGEVDPLVIDTAVDFLRTYADRTHHGKEEDILFRDLDKKNLSPEDRRVMNELIREHILGRDTTKALDEANRRYGQGDASALTEIADNLKTLVGFYPGHIEKEDHLFFPASRSYFTDEEDQAMLAEFREFDRKMIYEKYKTVVEVLE